ncbi:MAG: (d)CMP kinase [Chloroflexi bacterium]|nr:(d)CMP kinase [Chloroflexota bacterium]
MTQISIIAIDGPAASGKSTLAFRLARALGYLYFDTGLMYRAVTWLALNRKIEIKNEAAVTALAEEIPIEVSAPSLADGRSCDVVVDGRDITWDIRKPEVEAQVSAVSAYAGVRNALTLQQRRIGLRGRVVMVGRDIGTVVLPDADLKIYLDASAEERARRRHQEILAHGRDASYEEILAKVIERDRVDSNRIIAPLKPANDAIILDSDQLDADKVFEKAYDLCKS